MATEKRLIDVNEAYEAVIDLSGQADTKSAYAAFWKAGKEIQKLPTVGAAEVVHAEWLDIRFDSMWRLMLATCSHCKVRGEVRVKSNECGFAVPDSDYCPHCGARMDGGINK